jgi:RNA polymerase sigma-70 factor (ECF subfamily)
MTAASSPSELATTTGVPVAANPPDGARLRALAQSHFASVWRFLRALGVHPSAVDDAAQEVFLVAARKLAGVRPEAERSFLFGSAVHVARELHRKHHREELVADPDDESLEPALHSTPEDALDRKEERDLLMNLLAGLTDELRTVFVLYELEGESIPEIAALLELPIGTVTSRLRRGREKFEARLERHQLRMRGEK